MRKFLILAALATPFFVSSIARADDDTTKPAKTKKMKKTKKTKAADGSTTTEKTEKTEKPADAPAPANP